MRNLLQSACATLVCVCFLALSGCKSPEGPGSDSLAFVELQGYSLLDIARATSEVFQDAGFKPAPQPELKAGQDPRLVFEKQGTRGDSLLYGDWVGGVIWYRAKVKFTSMGGDKCLVRCDAFRVTDKGDKIFETEKKLSKRGPYQELLNKVKARVQGQADAKKEEKK